MVTAWNVAYIHVYLNFGFVEVITEPLKQVSLPYLSLNKEKVWVR
jgi:hypothetical protein